MFKTMKTLLAHEHRHLVADLLVLLQQKVKRRGRRLSDLRFAKRTKQGYAFFEKTHDMWDILHEAVIEAISKHPQYKLSFVVELCSELVNSEEKDLSSLGFSL